MATVYLAQDLRHDRKVAHRELFSMEGFGRWSPAPGDRRFLMVRSRSTDVRGDMIVVENFFEELKAKVGK